MRGGQPAPFPHSVPSFFHRTLPPQGSSRKALLPVPQDKGLPGPSPPSPSNPFTQWHDRYPATEDHYTKGTLTGCLPPVVAPGPPFSYLQPPSMNSEIKEVGFIAEIPQQGTADIFLDAILCHTRLLYFYALTGYIFPV